MLLLLLILLLLARLLLQLLFFCSCCRFCCRRRCPSVHTLKNKIFYILFSFTYSQVAAGGMGRSNPVVNRSAFLKVAKSFFLEHARGSDKDSNSSYLSLEWAATATDPHFVRWFMGFAANSLLPKKEEEEGTKAQRQMLQFTDWAVGQTTK